MFVFIGSSELYSLLRWLRQRCKTLLLSTVAGFPPRVDFGFSGVIRRDSGTHLTVPPPSGAPSSRQSYRR
jgi:hypothetical protein